MPKFESALKLMPRTSATVLANRGSIRLTRRPAPVNSPTVNTVREVVGRRQTSSFDESGLNNTKGTKRPPDHASGTPTVSPDATVQIRTSSPLPTTAAVRQSGLTATVRAVSGFTELIRPLARFLTSTP